MNTCDHVPGMFAVHGVPDGFAKAICQVCGEPLYFDIILSDSDKGTTEVLDVNGRQFVWKHPEKAMTDSECIARYAELDTPECRQKLTKQISMLAGKPMSKWRITDDPETSA